MGEGNFTKTVVLSDIHFGARHDATAGEFTNTGDLQNFIQMLENEMKPKRIILLGDVLDLWRVRFFKAWDEAEDDFKFFSRLNNYVEANKEHVEDVIWVIGNHDHFIKELDFADRKRAELGKVIEGKDVPKLQEAPSLVNELSMSYWDEKTRKNIKFWEDKFSHIKIYYPHYKFEIEDGGVIYLDHGHFFDGSEKALKRSFGKIHNLLVQNMLGKIISKMLKTKINPIKKNADLNEIYADRESNLSAGYSAIYYSKMDDVIRTVRDLIHRTYGLLKTGPLGATILLIAAGLYVIFNLDGNPILSGGNILTIGVPPAAWLVLQRLGIDLLPEIMNYLNMNQVSKNRGKSLKDIHKQMTDSQMTIERDNGRTYTYFDFIKDCNKGDEIRHYIFGHTHVAGKFFDPSSDLNLYNTGSWLNYVGSGKHCSGSFIIIDESRKEDMVGVFRIDGPWTGEGDMEKIIKKCRFDRDGRCKNPC